MGYKAFVSEIRSISSKEKIIILSSLLLLLLLPLVVFISTSSQKQETRSQAAETSIDSLNTQVVENNRTGNIEVNQLLLEQRKEQMTTLAYENPQEFLSKAMSPDLRDSFPEDQRVLIEEQVNITGELLPVVIDNFETKETKTQYILKTDNLYYSINFATNFSEDSLRDSNKISLDGYILNHLIVANTQNIKILDANLESPLVLASSTVQEKNIAIWPLNFTDDRSEPWSKADIKKRVFCDPDCVDSVKTYYDTVSNGKLRITGRVLDWWKSDLQSRNMCSFGITEDDFFLNKAKAKNPSVFENYDGIVFIHPNKYCAKPWGQSTIGGDPSIAVVGQLGLHGLVHELGHSFGLAHSVIYNCNSGGCWDKSDVMGMDLANMNPLHKVSLNFISETEIKNFTSDGVYRVFKLGSGSPKIIKIDVPNDNWDIYIDYRNPNLKYNRDVPYPLGTGVLLYRWDGRVGRAESYTKLINITPLDDNENNLVLRDGRTAGWVGWIYITIEQVRHTDDYADIRITKN